MPLTESGQASGLSRSTPVSAPESTARYDWTATALALWMVGGLYLDGWAHTHGRVDQSVFTPWHGVLYSGFVALAGLYLLTYLRGRSRGLPIRSSMPTGYGLSLAGVGLFLAGGLGDTIWHLLLGIEIGVDALYSPTHLVLAVGGVLMISGPIRSAWRRPDLGAGWLSRGPMVIGLTIVFCILTFFTQVMHPQVNPMATGPRPTDPLTYFLKQDLGVSGILLEAVILTGLSLLAVQRKRPPFGTFTFMLGTNAWALSVLTLQGRIVLILAAALAGLVADILLRRIDSRRREQDASLAAWAFLVPAAYFLFYFIALLVDSGLWWTVHLWAGSPILAGIAGWLVHYVMTSKQQPGRSDDLGSSSGTLGCSQQTR